MKESLRDKSLKRSIYLRVIEIIVVIVLVFGNMYAYDYVQSQRIEVMTLQEDLESRSLKVFKYQVIQKEIEDSANEISELFSVVPPPEQVGDVVSLLESRAGLNQVQIDVPSIKEEIILDENKNPIVQAGPLFKVRISARVVGEPDKIMQFLRSLETTDSLIEINKFRLNSVSKGATGFINDVVDGEKVAYVRPEASLEVDVIVLLRKGDNYGK